MKNVFKFFLAFHIVIYRLTRGRFFNRVQGLPILLLTTTGRKTNKRWTTPLGYFMDGDRYIITASNAGLDTHPAWFYNLSKNPRVTIEVGDQKMHAEAEVVGSEKRSSLWAKLPKTFTMVCKLRKEDQPHNSTGHVTNDAKSIMI